MLLMINVLKMHCNCCVYDTEKQTFWWHCVNNYGTSIPIFFLFAEYGNCHRRECKKKQNFILFFFPISPKNRVGGSVNQFFKKKGLKENRNLYVWILLCWQPPFYQDWSRLITAQQGSCRGVPSDTKCSQFESRNMKLQNA
jgi:hypothetical protein